MSASKPAGTPACPGCEVPGEASGDSRRYDTVVLHFFTCFNRDCPNIEYDQHGGVHHAVSDPYMKREVLDEADLW